MHRESIPVRRAEAGQHGLMLVIKRRQLQTDLVAKEAEPLRADDLGLAHEAALLVLELQHHDPRERTSRENAQAGAAQIDDATEVALERRLDRDASAVPPIGVAGAALVGRRAFAGESQDSAKE